jgi:hypothetical protein
MVPGKRAPDLQPVISCLSSIGTFAAIIAAAVKLAGWSEMTWNTIILIWTVPPLTGLAIDLALMGAAAWMDRDKGPRE